MNDVFEPAVSVVINTLNRDRNLNDALRALEGLDYPRLEIVVVNGPSTDGTESVLDPWGGRIKRGRCAEPNLSVSRNIGIGLCAGDIIAFIDDDAAPHPRWIAELVEGFRDPRVGAVGGFTIDNTGVRWQVRKTVCDRFGDAFNVSNLFDERPLSRPGSFYFPSLLGTNSSFRATALREIGGFDHTFAYLLDETDVCLRLVDAGWRVQYEPAALVYHQFAPSHIRSPARIARTLYPSAVSKSYFIMRHGVADGVEGAGAALARYKSEILAANAWLNRHGRIDDDHRYSLDQDLDRGMAEGVRRAFERSGQGGDLNRRPPPPFVDFDAKPGLRIAMISQGFPPDNESGIARWTSLAAAALAQRGHCVHVITRTEGEERLVFEDGLWVHRLRSDGVGAMGVRALFDLPPDVADWAARVRREVQYLRSFGLQVVSFPIWDLEGVAVLDDADLAVVVSLHTTYAMAKPFKAEWNERPLFEHFMVDRVISGEAAVLSRAPTLLANSKAIVAAIQASYEIDLEGRCHQVPHGTPDPLATRAALAADRERQMSEGAPLRVLFVGRFEPRKGFDIAAKVATLLARQARPIEIWFAGGALNEATHAELLSDGVDVSEANGRIRFLGEVGRQALDDLYVDCDLLLAPSRFESFGLVGIEAMAAGRPVMVLGGSGLAEVVEDGVSGLCFPQTPDVVDQIGAAILRLDLDRRTLADMGRAARLAYENAYTVERMAEGLERCYRHAWDLLKSEART
jgi:glycosyltransferase involved in cell wall biosynthesis/GT2 family glycosyltransferase